MPTFCRLCLAVIAVLIQSSFFSASAQVLTPRFKSISSNTNAYYEYLPKGYNATDTTRWPLLIHIIGAGDLGNGTPSTITLLQRSGPVEEIVNGVFPDPVVVNGKSFGLIVIDPQFMIQPTVADVTATINFAIANYHVDTTRIYLTGLSMGGGTTWLYSGSSLNNANRLAAIVPVCGDITPDLNRCRVIAASNLPVWATHNDQDPLVPVQYTQQEIAYINQPPAPIPPAMLTIFHNNTHDAWTATYSPTLSVNSMNIYQWMLQYTRLTSTSNVVPVVTVGPTQSITLPTSTATLTGNAADSIGTITSHVWTFVSGPTTPVIANPSSYTTTVSGLTASGVYLFNLSASDSRNLTVFATAQINVIPPPTVGNRLLNVQLYGNNDPYVNTAWNNWNVASTLSSPKLNYSDGTPSNLSAVLSAQTAVADNGTNYVTVTMCPPKVGRYASYYSNSGGRTLTISGLDSTKVYRLDLFATRYNPNLTTIFATAGRSMTIPTYDNTDSIATFDNLTPAAGGKLVVTITHGQYYDYLNGFTITEKTVVNPSTPPTANAGADQTITLPVDSVILNGTASKGVNLITNYLWTVLSGTGTGALLTPAASKTVFTNLTAGTYNVQLKVTDDSSHIGLDTVKIIVNPAPAPVANAGADQTIGLPLDSVALNGSASTGSFITYSWATISGIGGTFTNPTGATTELDNLGAGTYLVTLTVTDITNRVSIDTVQITVKPAPPPPPPTAHAGADQAITLPLDSVALSGATSTGKDSIVSYQWSILSGPGAPILETPNAASTELSNLNVGVYQIALIVTDDSAQVGRDTVQVTVNPLPPPPPPVANGGPNQSITLPNSAVTLSAAASTGTDSIVSYLWTVLSGPAGDSVTAPDSVTTQLTNLSAGIYTVQLKVTDDSSQIGIDTVTITVISPAPNFPPLVTVGGNQSITTTAVNLTSSVTDPENMISSSQWTKVSAPGQRLMHIGVIGSSTMVGTGPTNIDSSLVNRIKRYYKANGLIDTVYNLAVGGSTVYNGVTADFVSPGPAPSQYDSTANVTAALSKGIDILIVGYPSNAYQIGQLTIKEIMAAHQNIFDAAKAAGVRCYIASTQPRTSGFDSADQQQLLAIRDSMLNRFGEFCMDFMTPMVYPGSYTVLPQYSAGDGLHLNSAAHAQLAAIIEATNPFKYIVSDTSVITNPVTVNTSVTGLDSGVHKFQIGAFDQYKLASSAILTVTVGKSAPLIPTANAGSDLSITLPTSTVTLTGTGSEPGGKIVSYKWTQTAGTTATIASPTTATTGVSSLSVAGTYSFALTVTDSVGTNASDTMNVVVNPAVQTTSAVINVNIYGNNDPYGNAAWNDWNLATTTNLTSGKFNYSTGTASGIGAILSAETAIADNGASYPSTMCPQKVARYASYYSGSGGRTLTITGLDSTKLYRLDFYSSRGYVASQNTIFAINGTSISIATNNNLTNIATFDNLVPATGGKLVFTITHSATYDYINGFTITEKTKAAGTATDSTFVTATAGVLSESPDTSSLFAQPLALYPDPTRGAVELHVNNLNIGRMKVDIFTAGGVPAKEFILAKTTVEMDTPLSLADLKPGTYFLVATIGNWRRTLKVIRL